MNDIGIDELGKFFGPHMSDNLSEIRDGTLSIISVLGDQIECLHEEEVKVKSWEYYFETLVSKIIFHSISICKLTDGLNIESAHFKRKATILDYSSLYILSRSIQEAYLTFEYIYSNSCTVDEKHFRFKLWQISGIISRQGYSTGVSPKLEKKKEKEREIIKELKIELENDPKFKDLNRERLKKLDKYGLPRLETWEELIRKSKLKTERHLSLYRLFSNYAHSEYMSILQLKQSNLNIQNKEMFTTASIPLTIIREICSLIIDWLNKEYEPAREYFKKLPIELQAIIQVWINIASGSNKA